MKLGVVDVFCGIGGLSYGFKGEGFDVIAGIDSDESCRYAYESNLKANFISSGIEEIAGSDISELFSRKRQDFRVLIGCAPCTPYSIYTGRYRKQRQVDERWQLLREFSRLVRSTRPDVVSMENVPRLTRHAIFYDFVRELEEAGYTITFSTVRAEHYGVPQRRARLVLFASLWGMVTLPPPSHKGCPRTVRDAIGKLPRIRAGQACSTDRLHLSRGLSVRNLARIRATGEGGSWSDWDHSLQLACHKKKQGKSFRSVYGRMTWDAPSPVITTQCLGIGNGRFGHPSQDRAISIREAALLQSFPKTFRFIEPKARINGHRLARQIGNAVPVRLARMIARAIKLHLLEVSASPDGPKPAAKRSQQLH
ncbi:MAG: (cytosine-5)-methyltransferase 1 [Methylobacteriaceae bacterium]|nr:(cytosine-5)-methyltransferase 1 [Methylobacteriaceae bacterium]